MNTNIILDTRQINAEHVCFDQHDVKKITRNNIDIFLRVNEDPVDPRDLQVTLELGFLVQK